MDKEEQRVEEVRGAIQIVLLRYFNVIHAELIHSHDDMFLTEQILNLKDKDGNLLLGIINPDQSLPKFSVSEWAASAQKAYTKAMLKDNWQKIIKLE